MVKKSTLKPLLSDDEIKDLLEASEKRENLKKPNIKPVDELITGRLKSVKKLPEIPFEEIPEEEVIKPIKVKPVKKPMKKAELDIIKTLKKVEKPQLASDIKSEVYPDIEYIIKENSKFDLNWYYIKELSSNFKKWILSPYTRYANWFNNKFNTPKISSLALNELSPEYQDDNIENLYEEIKKDFKPDIPKLMQHHTAKIPIVQEDISIEVIEKIYDEMRPAMVKQIYENINKLNKERTRKIIIKGGF